MSFRRLKLVNSYFKAGNMYIFAFTEKNLERTAYEETRTDFIISKIDDLFNSQRGIGIGRLEFVEMDEFVVGDRYVGSFIAYRPVDFN